MRHAPNGDTWVLSAQSQLDLESIVGYLGRLILILTVGIDHYPNFLEIFVLLSFDVHAPNGDTRVGPLSLSSTSHRS